MLELHFLVFVEVNGLGVCCDVSLLQLKSAGSMVGGYGGGAVGQLLS